MMIGNYHIGEDVKARWLGILSKLSGKGDKTVIRSNLKIIFSLLIIQKLADFMFAKEIENLQNEYKIAEILVKNLFRGFLK